MAGTGNGRDGPVKGAEYTGALVDLGFAVKHLAQVSDGASADSQQLLPGALALTGLHGDGRHPVRTA